MKKTLQAKHIDEAPILAAINARPGVWFTHWPGDVHEPMPSLRALIPALADIPDKVLRAKLSAMVRRGLIDGCDCGCRGDWQAVPA